ncbi:zinc finger protein PLAG1-like isoform X2 [Phlebotomus argentipes]|uniref:zinc finger protein PLAG1-like isoform X2 n=1 Tax=Phlebotomus argentipes TaxID=94469 RepID=UPI00289324C1|nr:zinc finger protein PLAG1-like isoform X2 [Phlebotomus argentipes]
MEEDLEIEEVFLTEYILEDEPNDFNEFEESGTLVEIREDNTEKTKTKRPKKKHKCKICSKIFDRRLYLRMHSLEHCPAHADRNKFPCHLCPAAFGEMAKLQKHLLVHSWTNAVKCSVCQKTYKNSVSLRNHMKKHAAKTV